MSLWKKEVHNLYFTCNICNQYAIFSSHCRYCGHYVCKSCNHFVQIDKKFDIMKCCNIPDNKRKENKACKLCLKQIILRKQVYFWMLYIKFLIERNDISFLKRILPKLCTQRFVKGQKVPILLKCVAAYFLKLLKEITCNSAFRYITDERQDDVIEFKHFLSSKVKPLLFFDICSRNNKFKKIKKLVKVKARLPFLLSAITSFNDYQLSLKLALIKKPLHHQIPSYIHIINKKNVLYKELIQLVPEFINYNLKLKNNHDFSLDVYNSYKMIYQCLHDYKEHKSLVNLKDANFVFNYEISKIQSFLLNKHLSLKNVHTITVNSNSKSYVLMECKFEYLNFYLYNNHYYIINFCNAIKIYESNNDRGIISVENKTLQLKDFYKKPCVLLDSFIILCKLLIIEGIHFGTRYNCSQLNYVIDNDHIILLDICEPTTPTQDFCNDSESDSKNSSIIQNFKSLLNYAFVNQETIYWQCRILKYTHDDALFVSKQDISRFIPQDIIRFSSQFNLI